jgi:hypothetical protein
MGDRRMFSLKIINTSKFLRLPSDTQNLYFHLGLRADDDGIVEAYPVMNTIKASEDSLKLLHAKDLIKVLNDDLITYITDWSEHNTIRADRKVDSIYKDLLVQILPDVKLKESKQRADRPEKIIEIGQPMDDIGTSQGQPKDGISKDKLSKDNISKKYIEHFEILWKLYPKKEGKGSISDTQKKKIYEIPLEEMTRTIERYKAKIQKEQIEPKFIKQGSTFFNSGYIDFLDENWTGNTCQTQPQQEKSRYRED